MTRDLDAFSNYTLCNTHSTICIADGTLSKVMGKGSVKISRDIILNSVLYVPKLNCNLLSVSKLTKDLNHFTNFSHNMCEFHILESGMTIGNPKECVGLYLIQDEETKAHSCVVEHSGAENSIMLWHYRLGHPNFMYLRKMFPALFNNNKQILQCEVCQLSKHTRNNCVAQHYKPTQPFSLIHSDVWRPLRVNNITRARWFVIFIDDHTKVTWIFLMKEKFDVGKIFENFHSMVQAQFQANIKIFKTNNGHEYFHLFLNIYL